MRFQNREYKLNQLLEVIYVNKEGYLSISMGRLYDYSCKYICLDCSEDYWDLEDTVEIQKDKIKSIRKVNTEGWDMWR